MPDQTGPRTAAVAPDRRVSAPAAGSSPRSVWTVLGAISVGGALGSLGRYALSSAFPHEPAAFAWATFGVNASGCLLMGVLMALVEEIWSGRRLVRPFLGVGVLGGFTTFSTYSLDANLILADGAVHTALAYVAGTVLVAPVAVWVGATATRRMVRSVGRGRPSA
jgi:fluoride exporter